MKRDAILVSANGMSAQVGQQDTFGVDATLIVKTVTDIKAEILNDGNTVDVLIHYHVSDDTVEHQEISTSGPFTIVWKNE